MDITKCLYTADNNRFVNPWDIKKRFADLTRTVSSKKLDPPRPYYMRLDSSGMEEDNSLEMGNYNVGQSPPVEIMKSSGYCGASEMPKATPKDGCEMTPASKPKRARNGFTSIFQFVSGFVGTKSLLSARMQPLAFRDQSRPTLNVGNIFEMYQESCLVEDSIRNSRKMQNKVGDNSTDESKMVYANQERRSTEAVKDTVDSGAPCEGLAGVSQVLAACEPDGTDQMKTVPVTTKDAAEDLPVVNLEVNALQNNIDDVPKECDLKVLSSKATDCSTVIPEIGLPNSAQTCSLKETLPVMESASSNSTAPLPSTNTSLSSSTTVANSTCGSEQNAQKRRRRRARNGAANVPPLKESSEQCLNWKNCLLSRQCVQLKPNCSATQCIPESADCVTNGETLLQKRVNDHAVSKYQKRSRKRSRRKARRQRKSSPPSECTAKQQATHIPSDSTVSDTPAKGAIVPCITTSTSSLPKVEAQMSQSVATPICFVQPLCANAAIAFILGVCSDESESDDDGEAFEWDVGGDDSWEKSNDLWESFQCAQLQLSNLTSPALAATVTRNSSPSPDKELCFDEVDGVTLPSAESDRTSDSAECDHACREYPNGCQLSTEQLHEVNRRWAVEVEQPAVPRDESKSEKKVRFAEGRSLKHVRHLCTWNYAHRAARKGEWEQYARDRARFRTRIEEVEKAIGHILTPEHRTLVYQKHYSSSLC